MKKFVVLSLLVVIAFSIACVNPPQTPDTSQAGTPVIVDFSVSPLEMDPGGTATLNWQVTGATEINIDQGIGKVEPTGQTQVSPAETAVYTIAALNNTEQATKSIILTVNSLSADTDVIARDPGMPEIPVQLAPVDGAVFNSFPRTTKLEWSRSKGTQPISYVLQIQFATKTMPGSFTGYYPDLTMNNTSYSFEFADATIGRWRVKAKNAFGESDYSSWKYFQYTR